LILCIHKGYNFAQDLILVRGLHTKLWAPKVVGVPTVGILKLPLGSPRTKWHLGAGPVARHKVVASPKFGPWWVLLVRVCLCLILAPKVSSYALTNLLFGFVQVRVSEWLLVIFLNRILELQHAPLPPKCCEPRNVPQLLTFPLFSP
jgi:hypothetical protein